MKLVISLFVGFYLILVTPGFADEIQELRKDVALIQSRIDLERARYQEAKAKMERSELVAKYLLPELQAREKELEEKIRGAAGSGQQADKAPNKDQ